MKLLIADDHTLFRDALVQYIERAEPGSDIVLCKDLYEAKDTLINDQSFDLILLDFKMPGMNGINGFKEIKEKYPDLRVGLMSGVAELSDVKKSMELGSVGFFPKTLSGKALIKSIQLVLAGERYLPIDHDNNVIMPSYLDDNSNFHGDNILDGKNNIDASSIKLTPREIDVLEHLIQGLSNKEIARLLDLQVVTIKLHVRGICRKLGAKNRTQAALKAKEIGII